MKKTKYIVKYTNKFKKDFKLAIKRGLDISLLEDIIAKLSMGETLPEKNLDHNLTGNWMGHRVWKIKFNQKIVPGEVQFPQGLISAYKLYMILI